MSHILVLFRCVLVGRRASCCSTSRKVVLHKDVHSTAHRTRTSYNNGRRQCIQKVWELHQWWCAGVSDWRRRRNRRTRRQKATATRMTKKACGKAQTTFVYILFLICCLRCTFIAIDVAIIRIESFATLAICVYQKSNWVEEDTHFAEPKSGRKLISRWVAQM